MAVKLLVAKGRTKTRVIELYAADMIIGRQGGCAVRIPSAEVSRQHCRLSLQNGMLMIEDLNSVNGTFLNGQQVTSKRLVQPGDQLRVGPLTFIIDYPLDQASCHELFPANQPQESDVTADAKENPEPYDFRFDKNSDPAAQDKEPPILLELDGDEIENLPDEK